MADSILEAYQDILEDAMRYDGDVFGDMLRQEAAEQYAKDTA